MNWCPSSALNYGSLCYPFSLILLALSRLDSVDGTRLEKMVLPFLFGLSRFDMGKQNVLWLYLSVQ